VKNGKWQSEQNTQSCEKFKEIVEKKLKIKTNYDMNKADMHVLVV